MITQETGFYSWALLLIWCFFLAWSAYATIATFRELSMRLRLIVALCWSLIVAWTVIGAFEAFGSFTYVLPLLGVSAAGLTYILRGQYPDLSRTVRVAAVMVFLSGAIAGEVLAIDLMRIPGPQGWPPSYLFFLYGWVCLYSAELISTVSLPRKLAFIISWLLISSSVLNPLSGFEQVGELGVFVLALAIPAPVQARPGSEFLRRIGIASALILFAVSVQQMFPSSSGSNIVKLQAQTVMDVFALSAACALAALGGAYLYRRSLTIGSGLVLLPVASLIYLVGLYFPVLQKRAVTDLLPWAVVIVIAGLEMQGGQNLVWSQSGWRRAENRPTSD